MSKKVALTFVVYENDAPKLSAPIRPSLDVIRRGANVISLFQRQVGVSVGKLLTEKREVGLFVQGIVAEGFGRQDLSEISQSMDGLRVWILSPDEEYVYGAHAFEGHLQVISGRWFVEVAGATPYRITSSDTIYIAPFGSSW